MTTRPRRRAVDPLADVALAANEYTEAQYSKHVRAVAVAAGYQLAYHTHRSTFSPSGFPDETFVSSDRKRVVHFELKRDRKSPVKEEQIDWLEGIRAAGGEAYLGYGDEGLQPVADILTGPRRTSWPVSIREQIEARGGVIQKRKIRGEPRYRAAG